MSNGPSLGIKKYKHLHVDKTQGQGVKTPEFNYIICGLFSPCKASQYPLFLNRERHWRKKCPTEAESFILIGLVTFK